MRQCLRRNLNAAQHACQFVGKLDAVLRAGDRVEIYRALVADPKEIRKQRAAEGKKMTKGGGES